MGTKIQYGIFGDKEVEVDDDGYMEIAAIVQESGLYCGAPPPELRIHSVSPFLTWDEEFAKQYCAKLNRKTDLPFYLTKMKVKHTGPMVKITDEDLVKNGIELLKD